MAAEFTHILPFPEASTATPTARLRGAVPDVGPRLGRFAVVVNANARGYQKACRKGVFAGVPAADLYESRSLAHSERLVREIVEAGYDTVFAAGGDGTIAQLLNDVRAACPNPALQPRVGILRMGTGNALASQVGVDRAGADLARLLARGPVETRHVQMLEVEGKLTPFTGCGADAGVLNDYIGLKDQVAGTPLANLLTGVRGYLAAGVLKTAPALLSPSHKRRVFVINDAPIAYAVNKAGEITRTFRRGDVLYSGPSLMAAAGSIPFYGYELKMFPAATRLPGFFQVRVADMNPMMVVARLPKLWRGQLDERHGVHDFLCSKVRFEFDGEVPFHVSGDAAGYRREVSIQAAQRRFEFVRPL